MRVARDETEYLFTRLKILRGGKWEKTWETGNINYLACGQPIVGDFDGDGELEACVTPWYYCYFYDLKTGREKYVCPNTPDGMESGRAYGITMAVDIDGDGVDEAMTMSFMENHVTMMKYSGGKMERLWGVLFERGTMQKKSVLHIILDPAADMDYDGVKEICVPLYNLAGDKLWHLMALNGNTGEVKYDLPGFYLKEIKNIDGECYLFGNRTDNFEQGEHIQILKLADGKFVTVFDRQGYFPATPVTRTKNNMTHNHGMFPTFQVACLEDSQGTAFFTREGDLLHLYRIGHLGIAEAGSVAGAETAEIINVVSHEGTALLRILLKNGCQAALKGDRASLQFVGRTISDHIGRRHPHRGPEWKRPDRRFQRSRRHTQP